MFIILRFMRTHSVTVETAIKKIRLFYRKQRRFPTYEEMAKLFKFASKRSSLLLVDRLVEAGFLEKDNKGRVTLLQLFQPIPLLSTIPSGPPTDAIEQPLDTLRLGEDLVKNPESSFALQVTGDSMEDEGIREGDIVVVDKKIEPKQGDIVAARVDDQDTLKFLMKENGHYCLVPANKKYNKIYPKESLTIEGVIVSVVRKYH